MKKLILLFPIMIVLSSLSSGHVEAQHPADSNNMALLGHNELSRVSRTVN